MKRRIVLVNLLFLSIFHNVIWSLLAFLLGNVRRSHQVDAIVGIFLMQKV